MIPGIAAGQTRAASGGGGLPTTPGQAYGGGYFAGDISYGGKTYKIIVAPADSEQSYQWKTTATSTSGTASSSDGLANSNAMNNASHPAAQYARGYAGGEYSDWYLPAPDEALLFFTNLDPTSGSTPAIFQTGGAQAFTTGNRWTSREASTTTASQRTVTSSSLGGTTKTNTRAVRPIRRIEV